MGEYCNQSQDGGNHSMQCNGELIVGNVSTAFELNASESCGTGVGNSVRPDVRTGGLVDQIF